MKNSIQYDRDTIEDCLILLVMADIRLYREKKMFDSIQMFNLMVICRLLNSSHLKAKDLWPAYQQIISEFPFEQLNNIKTAELEFSAVLRVIRLINPEWKIS